MSQFIKAASNNGTHWKRAIKNWRIKLFPRTRPYHHKHCRRLVHGGPRQF